MVNESRSFALVAVLTVVGLGALLYGVYLSAGEHMNAPTGVGGALLIAGVGVLTAWMMRLEAPAEE